MKLEYLIFKIFIFLRTTVRNFLVLFLCSIPFSAFSEVGDLYYCEMTQAIEIKEGKLIQYIPQKFKFRVVNQDLIQFGVIQTTLVDLSSRLLIFLRMASSFMEIILNFLLEAFILLKYSGGLLMILIL